MLTDTVRYLVMAGILKTKSRGTRELDGGLEPGPLPPFRPAIRHWAVGGRHRDLRGRDGMGETDLILLIETISVTG